MGALLLDGEVGGRGQLVCVDDDLGDDDDVYHLVTGPGGDDGVPGHGADADELALLVDGAVDADGYTRGVDGGELWEDLASVLDALLMVEMWVER